MLTISYVMSTSLILQISEWFLVRSVKLFTKILSQHSRRLDVGLIARVTVGADGDFVNVGKVQKSYVVISGVSLESLHCL